jgi:hypothetical protein
MSTVTRKESNDAVDNLTGLGGWQLYFRPDTDPSLDCGWVGGGLL